LEEKPKFPATVQKLKETADRFGLRPLNPSRKTLFAPMPLKTQIKYEVLRYDFRCTHKHEV